MINALLRWIGVKLEDWRKLALMTPIFFLCGISEMLNYNGYMTLFNDRFGSEYLPYVYAVEAVILPLEAWLMSWLASRLPKPQWMRTMYLVMGTIVALNAAVLLTVRLTGLDVGFYYPFLFLTSSFVVRQQTILLWSLAIDLCPTQQAKRVMPVFVSGAALGGIAAGLISQAVSRSLGADAVYMLAPLLLLAGAFNYWRSIAVYLVPLTLKEERSAKAAGQTEEASSMLMFKRVFQSPYLLCAVAIMTLMPALYFLMEYTFLSQTHRFYPNETDFAAFFGQVTTLLFTFALLLQLVSGRLMSALGPSSMLAAIAAVFAASFVLVGATLGLDLLLYTLSAGYMFVYLLLYYFAEPANQMFFKLLPIQERDGYRYIAQGIAASGGILLGALLQYLHAGAGLSWAMLVWTGAIGSVLLVVLAVIGRQLYIKQLVRTVQTMTADGTDLVSALDEFVQQGRSDAVLHSLLHHDNDYARELALELIGRLDQPGYLPELLRFADDPSARLRLAALRAMRLEEAGLQTLVRIAAFLEDDDYEVRAQAANLLGTASHLSHQAVYFIRLKLLDPHPKVVAEAIKALHALGSEPSYEACYEVIGRYLDEMGEPAVYMCRTIAELGLARFLHDVEQLLGDADPAVRAEAISCMGALKHTEVIPWLLEGLEFAEPALHETTVEAFARMGEEAVEPLLLYVGELPMKAWNASVRALSVLLDDARLREQLVPLTLAAVEYLRSIKALSAALHVGGQRGLADLAAMRSDELRKFVLGGCWAVMERLGEEDVMRAIRLATEDADEEVRENGMEALAEGAGDKRLAAAILQLLAEWGELAHADMNEGSLDTAIGRMTIDRDPWLRLIAADALERKESTEMNEPRQLLGMLDKVLFLKEVPFFKGLTLEELGYVAGIAEEEIMPAGKRLFTMGQPNTAMGVIMEGAVELTAGNSQEIIARLGPRYVYGESSSLYGTLATANGIAAGPRLRQLTIDGQAMSKLIQLHPGIGIGMLRATFERVRRLEQRIAKQQG
ncbi:Npt1/Npt2 family nucleotide transporter [Paenibacillus xanthanilyticus]|uniref:ADP,ATP carrier protein n=1 Tax=Paenibacillus xanthanilyticus TaxID=1783531 RepID=A0ABV8K7B8_9BACL